MVARLKYNETSRRPRPVTTNARVVGVRITRPQNSLSIIVFNSTQPLASTLIVDKLLIFLIISGLVLWGPHHNNVAAS